MHMSAGHSVLSIYIKLNLDEPLHQAKWAQERTSPPDKENSLRASKSQSQAMLKWNLYESVPKISRERLSHGFFLRIPSVTHATQFPKMALLRSSGTSDLAVFWNQVTQHGSSDDKIWQDVTRCENWYYHVPCCKQLFVWPLETTFACWKSIHTLRRSIVLDVPCQSRSDFQ